MNEIVILRSEDWMGLYINGECRYQGHSVEIYHLAHYTPILSIKEISVEGLR